MNHADSQVKEVDTPLVHAPEPRESELFEIQVQTLTALGFRFGSDSMVLDYGCGDGWLVRQYRKKGIQAYGCDVDLSDVPAGSDLQQQGVVAGMSGEPLRIPFADNMFDLLTSNMVFEHVLDYDSAFSEIHRVLKPGGMMLHVFVPRYSPLEQHCFVPLAGVIQSYWWLYLWASLGIRNEYQKGLSAEATARRTYNFLRTRTCYLSKGQIKKSVGKYFDDYAFREDVYLKFTPRGRGLPRILQSRMLAALYSATKARVLVATKQSTAILN